MFCPKCGSGVADGAAFCATCGAQLGGSQAAVSTQVGAQPAVVSQAGAPTPKNNAAKVGVIAAVVVVVVVLVAGFATNWFGLAGVQPKEAVDVPAPAQSEPPSDSVAESDGQAGDGSAQAGDGQSQQAGSAVKSAVEAYTWEELSQISSEIAAAGSEDAAIEVAKKYNLCTSDGKLDGTQVKSVTLTDGTQTTVQVVGFAHDDKTSGGKAGITFIFGDAIAKAPADSSATNAGGWEASRLRAYLNSDGMALLPQELADAIVAVDKLTNNVGETRDVSSVSVTSDILWLPSLVELAGFVDNADFSDSYAFMASVYDAEGEQYLVFNDTGVAYLTYGELTDDGNSVLVKSLAGEVCDWFCRSPRPDSDDDFVVVSGYGDVGYSTMSGFGIVPCFCI